MIKFIKSFFTKKTPPVVQQQTVEKVTQSPVEETVVEPKVENPIIHTMVITPEESIKNIVAEPARPEKKKRKSTKTKQAK
jgi:hypothetical protein